MLWFSDLLRNNMYMEVLFYFFSSCFSTHFLQFLRFTFSFFLFSFSRFQIFKISNFRSGCLRENRVIHVESKSRPLHPTRVQNSESGVQTYYKGIIMKRTVALLKLCSGQSCSGRSQIYWGTPLKLFLSEMDAMTRVKSISFT